MQNDMPFSDYLAFNIEIFIKLFEDGTFCDAETLRKQVEITFWTIPILIMKLKMFIMTLLNI